MMDRLRERFITLCGEEFFEYDNEQLRLTTLSSFGRQYIGLNESVIIDLDAEKTKNFQLDEVRASLRSVLERQSEEIAKSRLLIQIGQDETIFEVFANLMMAEISIGIKSHGLNMDRRRYVESERHLSRLHGLLTRVEREFAFSVFEQYHRTVFEQYAVLDSDDIALELLARLRAPVRQLKRKVEGYDYVFVDETQLFNENERRIFPLLTNGKKMHVPIALALDEAQEPYGQNSAGLALLGFQEITSEVLPDTHRSTSDIIKLSFSFLQRTTDLFGQDFPDYTKIGMDAKAGDSTLAKRPEIVLETTNSPSFGKFVLRLIRSLRKENIWQIAIVCHSDVYWTELNFELSEAGLPLYILLQRGQYITPNQPMVVLSRPAFIGGQEFDAVVPVGLEQGVYPPRIRDNDPLAAALEQQALREMYLSFTRARYRVIVPLSRGASPNIALQEAINVGLISSEKKDWVE
jgi:superfamily I DNA/RNA helicase